MRNPARKALYATLASLAAAASIRFGIVRTETMGEDWTAYGPILLGLAILPFALVTLVQALFAARGSARLRRGEGVVARWRVQPREWARFRGLDDRRVALGPEFGNDLWIRKAQPTEPVEVIVGEKSLLVDDSYHGLSPRGLPELREVRWLEGPPTCLEFALLYPRGRYGGTVPMTLRVPVPAAARGEARRVFAHFESSLSRRRLAVRDAAGNRYVGVAVFALSAGAAAAGWLLARLPPGSVDPHLPIGLMIGGCAVAGIFALILLLAAFLPTRR